LADRTCGILVVEDDPLIRRLLTTALVVRGHSVETCADGATGLYEMKKSLYDVLITDYHMPGMTGMQLVEGVREAKIRIATILMSGSSLKELGLTARDLDGIQFLQKPFGIGELLVSLRKALKSGSR